ncbi:MAG TPA: DNA polymerase III subunit alpha [Thermomicrobiales bacterium]|nr:DNA polymerase III subunit alpha [Thermomicrobiales bacterium]
MYTELHLHTSFSFLDGASQPDELVRRAQEFGYTALAITDHDGLHGALEFAQLAEEAGIQPITGAEITLADGSHLTLLAETPTGYANLCRVLTHLHHGRHPAPVALSDDPEPSPGNPPLGDYAEGIILLTGCRKGQLSRVVGDNNMRAAIQILDQYIAWFGHDNVFVELQQNEVFGDTVRIRALVDLANAIGLGCVATGNVHYHTAVRHRLQDVLVAIRNHTTLDGCHRERRPNARFALPTHMEMERRFAEWPEAIANTQVIAERCEAFRITRDLKYTFPAYDAGTGETPDETLARICWETFPQRYSEDNHRAREQIREELRLISRHNLAGFFLIYRDLLELAREVAAELRGGPISGSRRFLPPGRGRGSSVSSIVCYLIGLSPVDPLAHDLYVGRFLNEEMPSIPDIDLDFPREIRERLIERVYDVYGADHAALVCAFSTYRLRSAVRDVGKALGLPLADLDRISRLSEPRSADSLAEELNHLPEYAARRNTPPWSYLIELAKQLAGFPRHVTQHSGGMIVSATPLNEIVPIQPAAMEGRFMCQWDKDSCEDARFIKIDFLALGMLSLVEEVLDLIDESGANPVDLSRIDFNDPAVYRMIQAGDTFGVFQIESRAQIQMLRRTLPARLDDLVVQVAIVRPGPIVGGAVTPYVQRRENPDYIPEYDHPRLEPLLKETLGVILYQEQVVQVAEELAGFTPGQADQLRRAMTRKRSAEAMEVMRSTFIGGALGQGVDHKTAEAVFDKLTGFAEYGFPKSHAAAFALLAYQSCWLRHYYPAEFLCALLNNQPMGFYAPHVLVNDAKRHGIPVLRPDVNESEVACTVAGRRSVRIGLAFVKGLGEDVATAILLERLAHGPYRSLADLIRRVPLRQEAVRHLIAAGACDGFGMHRREMIWQLGLFIPSRALTKGRKHKTEGRQLSLALPTEQDAVELPRTSAWERMAGEYRILGMSTTFHPMALLRPRLPKDMVSTRNLRDLPDGAPIRLPGLIVCRQRPGTAKGITFLLLEDEFDLVNIVVHPWLYEKQRHHVRATPLLVVHGRLQHAKNNINVVAESVQPIEDMQLVYPYDGHDPRSGHPLEEPREEVDPRVIRIIALREERTEGPRRRADIRSISPDSHNYR